MASTSNKKQASGTKTNKQSPEPPIASTSHKSTSSMGLGLIIIAIGTSLVGLGVLGYLFYQELLSGSQRELEQATNANSLQIETKLANIQQTVQGVAGAARILSQQQPKPTSFVPYQRLVAESLPTTSSLVAMGIASSGNLLFPSPKPNVTYVWKEKAGLNLGVTGQKLAGGNQLLFANRPDIQKEASYQQALKGQAVWSQPYQSLGTTIVTYNVPIKDGQRTLGVVNADAIANDLFSLKADDPNLGQKLGFVVINSSGKVISASEQFQSADPTTTETLTSLAAQAKSQPTGVTQAAGNIWAYRKVAGSDWVVATYLPASSVLGKLLIPLGGVLLGISAILAIAISNFVGSLKKRLQPLNEDCAQFLDQRGNSIANITGKDEIDQLGLLLKGTFQQIKVDEIELRNELIQSPLESSNESDPETYIQSDIRSDYIAADVDLGEHDDVDLMDVVASLDDDIPNPSLAEQAVAFTSEEAFTPEEFRQTDIDNVQNLEFDTPDFDSDEPIIVETAENAFAQADSQELETYPSDSLTDDEAFLEEELLTELKHEVYDQDASALDNQVESAAPIGNEREYDPMLADATSSFVEDTSFGVITPLSAEAYANVPTSVDFNIPDLDDDFNASDSEMSAVIDDESLFFAVNEPTQSTTTATNLEPSADFDPFASDTPFATESESFAVEADDVFAVSSSDLSDLEMDNFDDDAAAYGAESYTEQGYNEGSADTFSFDSSIDYIPSEEDEFNAETPINTSNFDASIDYNPDDMSDEFNEFIETPLEAAAINPFEHDTAANVLLDDGDFDQIFDAEDAMAIDEPVEVNEPLSNTEENIFAYDQELVDDLDQNFATETDAFAESDLNSFADLSPELDAFAEPDDLSAIFTPDLSSQQIPDVYFEEPSDDVFATDISETFVGDTTTTSEYPVIDDLEDEDSEIFQSVSEPNPPALEMQDYLELDTGDEQSLEYSVESDFDFADASPSLDDMVDLPAEEDLAAFAQDDSGAFSDLGDLTALTSEIGEQDQLNDDFDSLWQADPVHETNELTLPAISDPFAEEDFAANAANEDIQNRPDLPDLNDPFASAIAEYAEDLDAFEDADSIASLLDMTEAIQDIPPELSEVAEENMAEFANLFDDEDDQLNAEAIADTLTDRNLDRDLDDDNFAAPLMEEFPDSQSSLDDIFEDDSFDLDSLDELSDLPEQTKPFSESSNDDLDEAFDESDISSIFSVNLDELTTEVPEKSTLPEIDESASLNFSETWLENAVTDEGENENFNIEAFADFDDLGDLSAEYPSVTGISSNAANANLNNDSLDSLIDDNSQDWENLVMGADTDESVQSGLSELDTVVSASSANSVMADQDDDEFDLSAFDDLDQDLVNSARSEIEDFLAGNLNLDDLSDESFETLNMDEPTPKKDNQDKTKPNQSN